jgi:8-oxo-(d)GTP phosphatase
MTTLLIVRHASAGARGHGASDLDRPLDERGLEQAAGLVDTLLPLLTQSPQDAERLDVAPDIRSSPARRCLATIGPLATRLGTSPVVDDGLTEGCDIRMLLGRIHRGIDRPTVWASHGDVIPALLGLLAARGLDLGDRPRVQKGSTWALDLDGSEVRSATYLGPPG